MNNEHTPGPCSYPRNSPLCLPVFRVGVLGASFWCCFVRGTVVVCRLTSKLKNPQTCMPGGLYFDNTVLDVMANVPLMQTNAAAESPAFCFRGNK
jgi:hypothetical protein